MLNTTVQTIERPEMISVHIEESRDESIAIDPPQCWYMGVKFAGEWLTALMLVIVTSPLVLLLAVLVKTTSPGPAFYAQTRLGRNRKTYRIFKLRTMVHNAEASTGPVWAAKNDCRVTWLGKILRETHLDEFPQLWNVLRGEMGLIGPRPERPEIAARVERDLPEYQSRLLVRPGITGLAQMLAPADDPSDPLLKTARQKLTFDLHYIREVSFLLDMRITVATACHFLSGGIGTVRAAILNSHGRAAEAAIGMLLSKGTEKAA